MSGILAGLFLCLPGLFHGLLKAIGDVIKFFAVLEAHIPHRAGSKEAQKYVVEKRCNHDSCHERNCQLKGHIQARLQQGGAARAALDATCSANFGIRRRLLRGDDPALAFLRNDEKHRARGGAGCGRVAARHACIPFRTTIPHAHHSCGAV